jgi:hypothetical protein
MANFYSIEYFVDGEIDIKHAELSDSQLTELIELFNNKGVKFTINNLSKTSNAPDVNSIDVRDILGRSTPTSS